MRTRQLAERALLLACTGRLLVDVILAPSPSSQATGWALDATVAVLVVLHSPRRELASLYVALCVSVASRVFLSAASSSPWDLRSTLGAVACVGVALAWVSSLLFPWPDFSRLHGPFQVIGCRAARYGGVECRVFYPSNDEHQSKKKRPLRYAHHGHHLMTGMGVFTKMPAWLFHNMSNAHLAALEDAPVASAPGSPDGWPVVIFSHGLAGSLEMYSYLNQELASHGHVVVVPNHCDGSACVCSPEPGRIDYYHQITPEVRDNVDGAGFRFRNGQLHQRVREVRSLLDAIKQDVAVGSVFERCNLADVSIVGHSFGAATALSAAHQDARFKRMVLLDAWMEPLDDSVRDGLGARVPALHLMSEHFFHWRDNAESTERHARGCSHPQSRLTWLRGARHNNFSDMPVFSPTLNRLMKSAGQIDHLYALRAIGQLSAAFLTGSFDARVAEFPEVLPVGSGK